MARADARSIRFVRALLPNYLARLNERGEFHFSDANRTARLGREPVLALASQGVVAVASGVCQATGETELWLARQLASSWGFVDQHRILSTQQDGQILNLAESPLARLAALGKDGAPSFLSPNQVEAGERFRRLVERAQLRQRTTMSYDPTYSGGGGSGGSAGSSLTETVADARRALAVISTVLPADCHDVVFDVCGLLKGLQTVEAERGWPRRSAKLVLRIGLEQLAGHFGLTSSAVGPRSRALQSWLSERPALSRLPVK